VENACLPSLENFINLVKNKVTFIW